MIKKSNMKQLTYAFGLSLLLPLSGCIEMWGDEDALNSYDRDLTTVDIPSEFDYKTTSELTLMVNALDNQDKPLAGVPFSIYYLLDTIIMHQGKGMTTEDGTFNFSLSLPAFITEVEIETQYIGLPGQQTVKVQPGDNHVTFGGSNPQPTSGRMATEPVKKKPAVSATNARQAVSSLTYLSSYDADGVPNNLLPVNDHISQDLLDMINFTLPEMYPVPTYNPEYLDDNLIADTQLQDSAEVWVTYVHEGAWWRNTLGFYTYDLNNPPQSVNDISDFYVIFPNVSQQYQRGNLLPGNKVSLGTFSANTGIGWFLLPDAWNGSEATITNDVKYSNKNFNTFTAEEYRQHVVLLKDDVRELLLLGIEDISRPGGDKDFNDAVFYVTANPFAAIITDNLRTTKSTGTDTDGDGVSDINDAYPDDINRAFDVYYPTENGFGSLGFEDNWPERGDYDMNDVVVEYNYHLTTNASNRVVEMDAQYKLVATGASYDNGFGIELPISSSLIASSTITGGISQYNVDGKESGQDNAVFVIFDDAHASFSKSGPVNTVMNNEKFDPIDFELQVTFTEPIAMANLGYAPFNPFIFVDGDRSREVHLPDFNPTQKAAGSWFGTAFDTSDETTSRYYKSQTNLPWAINVPFNFSYPREYTAINHAHKKFTKWAEQGGTQFTDWYMNMNDYRNESNIYTK